MTNRVLEDNSIDCFKQENFSFLNRCGERTENRALSFCLEPLWDWNHSWQTNSPYLTSCLVNTVMTWPPIILLWLGFVYHLLKLVLKNKQHLPVDSKIGKKLMAKYFLVILLSISSFACLIHVILSDEAIQDLAQMLSLLARTMTNLLLGIFFYVQKKSKNVNCGPVWFYLLLVIILQSIHLSQLIWNQNLVPFKTQFIVYNFIDLIIQVFLFVTCSFADRPNDKAFDTKTCPKSFASIPSKLMISWFNNMAMKGNQRPLTDEDLWDPLQHERSESLFALFNNYWHHPFYSQNVRLDQISNKNEEQFEKNLWKILTSMFWSYVFWPSLARFITDLFQLINPLIIKLMITFITDSKEYFWHGIVYSLMFLLINLIQNFSSAYQQQRFSVLVMRLRTTLIGAIYRKSLLVSTFSRLDYTTGDIINLMSVDAQRFNDLISFGSYLWTAPVQIAIGFYLLWQELGPSVIGGFVVMVLIVPITSYGCSKMRTVQKKTMVLKDQRLQAINEMLNGIKVLKLYAWETAFINRIQKIRDQELRFMWLKGVITATIANFNYCSPFLITCSVFSFYILVAQGQLTAQNAFVTIALFNLLRVPFVNIPNMLTNLILTLVSVRRINKFLNTNEVERYITYKPLPGDTALIISDASFSWDQKTILLSNLNVTVCKKKITTIVGLVGSGKSSFLSAILGEMHKHYGSVTMDVGLKVAYVAQQAWIQNLTIRDNILFGCDYDKIKYESILDACALRADLETLDSGDLTEIGEKGINLSGGQKQRISIARACYSKADFLIFDDPLSAVDSHVSKHIFEKVFDSETGILRNKTRLLVTNSLQVLPFVDQIILLNNGIIDDTGNYQQLLNRNNFFADLINNYSNQLTQNQQDTVLESQTIEIAQKVDSIADESAEILGRMPRTLSVLSSTSFFRSLSNRTLSQISMTSVHSEISSFKTGNFERKALKLFENEKIEIGKTSFGVYQKFLSAFTTKLSVLTLIFNFLNIGVSVGANFWLSYWINNSVTTKDSHRDLLIYLLIGSMQLFFVPLSVITLILGCLKASRKFHQRLLGSIVKCPQHFFDSTPLGRILNRFSQDIDNLDTPMLMTIRVALNHGIQVLAILFIVAYQTPLILIFIVPMMIAYYFLQRFYVNTSRQLKRIEAASRSPIFTHFSETLQGISTIRAYGVAQRFINQSDQRVNRNQKSYFLSLLSIVWLQLRLELLGSLLIFFASLMAAISKLAYLSDLTGSQIGLSLSYALNITISLTWSVRMFAEIENNIVAVERIDEYTRLPSEAAWNCTEDEKLSSVWPENGAVQFKHYSTRYRPGLDLVLKKLDVLIRPGEKIGIVGRTGAGKSSLTLAIFRLIEATSGEIRIDNIDISKLGLQLLRSRITIIPQDPVLFLGTIRLNLDPYNNHNDQELWNVLELSHLRGYVSSLDAGLDHPVNEAGENFSVGQRQLFCLARALLRRTKVLILDEATAAIDHETDSLIQLTIRKELNNCTILTIAHRLHTILDSDRVLVLDNGLVSEFDSPKVLLKNKSTKFYLLAQNAGITDF